MNSQKARLQQYKASESKRTAELVNKMKDLEILENIDLNRILTELKSRDRKIEALSQETAAQKGELTHVVKHKNEREMQQVLKRLSHEREMKLQAYDRLEGLRVEMRTLEGQDMKSDLWKDKCRELFDICKDLERENDQLKGLVSEANNAQLLMEDGQVRASYEAQITGSKSTGLASAGMRSLPASRGGDRVLSNRPSGAAGLRLGAGTSAFPSVLHSGPAPDTFESLPQHLRKGIGQNSQEHPITSQGTRNPTHHETLHSENPMTANSGYPGRLHEQLADAHGMISLASGANNAQTLNPGQIMPEVGSQGGVFGPPLQPQRNVMTAGHGQRQRGQSKDIAKRLQTS